MDSIDEKYLALKRWFELKGSAAVAFSAGVDSTLLLFAALEALGDRMIAIGAEFCLVPADESRSARDICKAYGIRYITVSDSELPIDGFKNNPKDRCYLCKKQLMGKLLETARNNGVSCLAEGSNLDDTKVFRPGMKAVEELGVLSPFLEIGLTRSEIRELSRRLRLPTADKPSLACLASRFAYGFELTPERLSAVAEAEQFLHSLGFAQLRVRISSEGARIEVMPEELERLFSLRCEITEKLFSLGFVRVTADLNGFKSGSNDIGSQR